MGPRMRARYSPGVGRKRVVIAGLGDSGVLTAIKLARHADVVGISAKPALVSGQELGLRISRPSDWARDNWISFDRFRGLDRVRTVHGVLTGVDLGARNVFVQCNDGSSLTEPYDALVISTGVTNGFWRRPNLQSADDTGAGLQAAHDRLAEAESVIVVGGGAAAVSSASQYCNHLAGQASRSVLPRRERTASAPSADLDANTTTTHRGRCASAPRPSRSVVRRLRV
jgi:NADH dehydrogenase FAD-containing subunit